MAERGTRQRDDSALKLEELCDHEGAITIEPAFSHMVFATGGFCGDWSSGVSRSG